MGGSDQWGNIVNGIDLGRRMMNAQLFALTSPLITTSSGAKMGKTAAGAVWLNANLVSPYDYWQYWRNTEDGDVARFLKLFTDPAARRDRAARRRCKAQEINEAKKVLADRSDRLGARPRRRRSGGRDRAQDLRGRHVRRERCRRSRSRAPNSSNGLGVLTAFAEKTGLVTSNGEARRQIKAGGLKVNDATVTDEKMMLTPKDLTPEGVIKLSLGRKKHVSAEAGVSLSASGSRLSATGFPLSGTCATASAE